MRYFRDRVLPILTLYLMGEKDYMFIHPVKEMVALHAQSELYEIPNCGHVCNVEQPELLISVLSSLSSAKSVNPSLSGLAKTTQPAGGKLPFRMFPTLWALPAFGGWGLKILG